MRRYVPVGARPDFTDDCNPVRSSSLFDDNFYRCPNTGEWVYKYADERFVLCRATRDGS